MTAPCLPFCGRLLLLVILAAIVLGGGTAVSSYVEALWFESLGYLDVFWKTLVQATVYSLYQMTDPGMFYNREDLWSVATEVGMDAQSQQVTQITEPNFVLMTRSPMPELRIVVLALQDRLT